MSASVVAPLMDANHRIKYSGKMSFEFNTISDFVQQNTSHSIDHLKTCCEKVYEMGQVENADINEEDEEKDTQSVDSTTYHNAGSTYFMRCDAPPACELEELIQQIFRLHTQRAQFSPEISGVEWWTQVVDSDSDIGFHWDKDYGFEEETGVNLYPHLGTVTYLTDCGGPTLVLRRKGCKGSGDDHSGATNEVIVSRPVCGKHMKFDGTLLHAVPAALASVGRGTGNKRITLLANIWLNHIPIRAVPFPVQKNYKREQQKAAAGPSQQKLQAATKVPLVPPRARQQAPLDLHAWYFVNGGCRYKAYVPLPAKVRLLELAQQHHAYSLDYIGSGVQARVEIQKEAQQQQQKIKKPASAESGNPNSTSAERKTRSYVNDRDNSDNSDNSYSDGDSSMKDVGVEDANEEEVEENCDYSHYNDVIDWDAWNGEDAVQPAKRRRKSLWRPLHIASRLAF